MAIHAINMSEEIFIKSHDLLQITLTDTLVIYNFANAYRL